MTATGVAARQTSASPGVPDGNAARNEPAWPGLGVAATEIGVRLTPEQLARFVAYRNLLLDRGARINLTAIREPAAVERRLFLDALLLVEALDTVLAVRADDERAPRLVDVGSGAGFPGLALKIARPQLDVTLVEATGKKVAFLTEAIAALDLPGVVAVHARAEEIAHRPEHRSRYDVATARAVAALPALLELCVPLLKPGGSALFPKGTGITEELAAAERAAPLVGARLVGVDVVDDGTCLIRVAKVGSTPDRYPRRSGLPARDPLGAARHGVTDSSPPSRRQARPMTPGLRPTGLAGRAEG